MTNRRWAALLMGSLMMVRGTVPVLAVPADTLGLRSSASLRYPPGLTTPSGRAPAAVRYPSVPFVVSCTVAGVLADDPIVHPGKPGMSHMHTFFGSMTIGASMSVATMQRARTTCNNAGDHAAYWVPSPVGTRLRAYYDAGPLDPASIVAYTPDSQLVAGDRTARAAIGIDVLAFRCGAVGDGPDGVGWLALAPPVCSKGAARIARLSFAQCWDAISTSYGSMTATVGKTCPSGHAVAVPRLRLLVEVPKTAVSSGPLTSFHGDFLNGWSPSVLADLVKVCIRGERTSNVELKRCGLPGGQ